MASPTKHDLSKIELVCENENQKSDVAEIQSLLRQCSGVYFKKRANLTGSAKTAMGHSMSEELGFEKVAVNPKKEDDSHSGVYLIWDYSKTRHLFNGNETNPIEILKSLPKLAHYALNVGLGKSDVISRAHDATKPTGGKQKKHPMQDFYNIPRDNRKIKYLNNDTQKEEILDFSNIKGSDDLAVLIIGFRKGGNKVGLLESLIHDYNENTSFHGMRFLIAQISGSAEFESLSDKQTSLLIAAREQHILEETTDEQYEKFIFDTCKELYIMNEELKARRKVNSEKSDLKELTFTACSSQVITSPSIDDNSVEMIN